MLSRSFSLADFMAGRVFEFRQANPFTNDATQRTFGVYGQDTWRVSDKITMNYGMRYEPWFPQQHTNGTVYNFSTSAFLANARSQVYPDAMPGFTYPGDPGFPSKAGLKPNWMNFQPRVGVSWDPNGDGKTSVRAAMAERRLRGRAVPHRCQQAWPFGYRNG